MACRSSSTPAATNPTARQRCSPPHCAMATSSSKEPADNSTSPAGSCASTSRARRPLGPLAAEPRVDVHYHHLRPLPKPLGGKGLEHRGEIAVSRRLHV